MLFNKTVLFSVLAATMALAVPTMPLEGRAGLGFLDVAESVKAKAKEFVDSIPKDKLLGAGDAGNPQGTIASADGKGKNANGGRPNDGFRLDQQKPPSAGSPFQSNVQVQVNGPSNGASTIGGVRVPNGVTASPKTLAAKLKHSINIGSFADVKAPKVKVPKIGKKFRRSDEEHQADMEALLQHLVSRELAVRAERNANFRRDEA